MKLAVPDMVSNSYFPAEAAIVLGVFEEFGLDVSLELIFPVDAAYQALRDGAIDIVAGSAHSALSAFPRFEGVRLLCAQSQGMYWFLIMRSDLKIERGDVTGVKGRKIGAAPWVEMGLRRLLEESGIDIEKDQVDIAPVPVLPGAGSNFGLNAARALEEGVIDGFWANGMGAEIAMRDGTGSLVLDARRGDGPASAFNFTMASIAMRQDAIEKNTDVARSVTKAIIATQSQLKENPHIAAQVGEKIFPPREAGLIVELVTRDLPYYSPAIEPAFISGMSRFCRDVGILDCDLAHEDVIATQTQDLWRS